MAEKIPERLKWAVESLGLSGDEAILEIGCGRGVAVSLACPKLPGGTITAIDRSATAINAARERNAATVAAGKAIFRQAAIEEFEGRAGAFDAIFAVNVNLFWLKADRALAVIRGLLAEDGRLLLVYEPPSAGQRAAIAARLAGNLAANGFDLTDTTQTGDGLLAVTARKSAA